MCETETAAYNAAIAQKVIADAAVVAASAAIQQAQNNLNTALAAKTAADALVSVTYTALVACYQGGGGHQLKSPCPKCSN